MKTQLYSGANSSSKEDAFNPNHANDYSYSAFTQLKFELDGITTYGVAELLYINQGAPQLKSLSYEVNDAVNSVPEPAVWMEMIAGFGAIGAAIRRRRRVPLSFAAELGA
jgi:hypothetical protein